MFSHYASAIERPRSVHSLIWKKSGQEGLMEGHTAGCAFSALDSNLGNVLKGTSENGLRSAVDPGSGAESSAHCMRSDWVTQCDMMRKCVTGY